jgi:hypothetical protein
MKYNHGRRLRVVNEGPDEPPLAISVGDASDLFDMLEGLAPDPLENLGKLREIAESAQTGLMATLTLRRLSADRDAGVSRTATTALGTLGDAISRVPSLSREDERPEFVAMRRVDRLIEEFRTKVGILSRADASVRRSWTGLGLVLTLAGCVALVTGHPLTALATIGARLIVSLAFGSPMNLPFEGVHRRGESGLGVVVRCVAGHSADALMLLAVSWVLLDAHRPLWAIACLATSNLMLLATLARVASLQVGQQLFRLHLERLMRNAPLVLGLTAAVALQPNIPERGVPLVATTAVGSFAFALIEFARVMQRLRMEPRDGRGANRVVMTVLDSSGPRVLSTGPAIQDVAPALPEVLARQAADVLRFRRSS